jgi:hypothetical protein
MGTLRRPSLRPWRRPALLALLASLWVRPVPVVAQPVPSAAEVRAELDRVVGDRVEVTAILGGQEAPQGGLFTWAFNDVDASILKYPWSAEADTPRPLGIAGLTWTPVVLGSAGLGSFTNRFQDGRLAGNESTYTTYSAGLGTGPRIWFLPDLSVLPSFSLLYAYTENDFDAKTDVGRQVEAAVDERLVNWHTHTLTFIPSLALRYRPTLGRVTVGLTSTLTYFATLPVARSTEAYSFRSDSLTWNNRLEAEVLTPWAVRGWPLLAGGFLQRSELSGALRDSLRADHVYSTGAHVALDPKGRLWKLSQVGLAGSYFWADSFSGFTFGIHLKLGF